MVHVEWLGVETKIVGFKEMTKSHLCTIWKSLNPRQAASCNSSFVFIANEQFEAENMTIEDLDCFEDSTQCYQLRLYLAVKDS